MPLPRPATPRAFWNDLRAFWRERPRHQWIAGTLALLIPAAIVFAFYLDSSQGLVPREQITYVKSWPASRSDAEIIAQQRVDAERLRVARERRRLEFQRLDAGMNRLGI
jgi:hypothetical protein